MADAPAEPPVPELKEFAEFPGEKMSKAYAHPLRRPKPYRTLRGVYDRRGGRSRAPTLHVAPPPAAVRRACAVPARFAAASLATHMCGRSGARAAPGVGACDTGVRRHGGNWTWRRGSVCVCVAARAGGMWGSRGIRAAGGAQGVQAPHQGGGEGGQDEGEGGAQGGPPQLRNRTRLPVASPASCVRGHCSLAARSGGVSAGALHRAQSSHLASACIMHHASCMRERHR